MGKVVADVRPVYAMPHPSRDDTVFQVGRGGRVLWEWTHRELVEKLDPVDPSLRRLIEFLFVELQMQALRADFAVEVANVELRTHAKRTQGGQQTARNRRAAAKKYDEAMTAQAKRLRMQNPHQSIPELAKRIADRPDDGVAREASTIEKKLRKLWLSRKVDTK